MIETVGWWLTDLRAFGLIETDVRRCVLWFSMRLDGCTQAIGYTAIMSHTLPSIRWSASNLRQCGKKQSEGGVRMADCSGRGMFASHTIARISHYFIRCVGNVYKRRTETWHLEGRISKWIHRCGRQNVMAAHTGCFNLENKAASYEWNSNRFVVSEAGKT